MTREQQIRARLKSASRAFSFLGAIGVAKGDVEYLLDRVDALERLVGQLVLQHDEYHGDCVNDAVWNEARASRLVN